MLEGSMIEKIPMTKFIVLFVFYILTHIGIGMWVKYLEKQKQTVGIYPADVKENLKVAKIIFKWTPALFVVIILIMLLL